MIDKLTFKFAEPEHVVLPMKMDKTRWFAIAEQNNALRAAEMRRCWYAHEINDLYTELHS